MHPQIIFQLNKALEALRESNLDSAEVYLKQAALIQNNNPHVLRLQAIIFAKRKQYQEAIKLLLKSLKYLPKNAIALSNLGNIYLELGDYEKALNTYDIAIEIDPNYDEVWTNKGIVLGRINRLNEALDHHQTAISINPKYAEAWANKGNVLHELKRYDEAVNHYDTAIKLKPQYAEAWYQKAKILAEFKYFTESISQYEKAISLDPNIEWLYGELIHTKMRICDWSSFNEITHKIKNNIEINNKYTNPFVLLSITDDISLIKLNNAYASKTFPLNSNLGRIQKPLKSNKIRIGYFSCDFHDHPVTHLTSQLFEIHNRSQFEVFAFSLQKSPPNDFFNDRLRNSFDKFVEVDHISDQEVARLARDLKIDIAVDLSGHTRSSRPIIFSYRAAPIQVNWLGFPNSFGANYMDYIIADKIIIPADYGNFYDEKIVYLPDTFIVDDSNRVPSSKTVFHEQYGLPRDKFIFCSFNNFYKFNPWILDSWSKILRAVPESILWISENNELFQSNLIAEFLLRDINSSRIIFAQREDFIGDHLARLSLANLFLDTFPYNAHSTALDALKAGLPIITRFGQSFASRVAASLLHTIGLPELITSSQEDYENLAIDLAKNPEKLASIKNKLLANRLTSPLFNTALFAKNIECAYLKMYERYHSGLDPENIFIDNTY